MHISDEYCARTAELRNTDLKFCFLQIGSTQARVTKRHHGQLVVKNALSVNNGHPGQTQKEQEMISVVLGKFKP